MSNGYRLWMATDDGTLTSPLASTDLPVDGVLVAHCDVHAEPPARWCECGVHYWPDPADALTAWRRLGDPGYVITKGELTSPTVPDSRMQLYSQGYRQFVLPAGRRCAMYAVTEVYADPRVKLTVNFPVHRMTDP